MLRYDTHVIARPAGSSLQTQMRQYRLHRRTRVAVGSGGGIQATAAYAHVYGYVQAWIIGHIIGHMQQGTARMAHAQQK